MEGTELPLGMDFSSVTGLRSEAVESLLDARPETLGAAGRLAGVTPADIALLEVALKKEPTAAL